MNSFISNDLNFAKLEILMPCDAVNPERISQTYGLILPHIRRTPVVEVDPADFGLSNFHLAFKLELLQHAGSFKTRGAFTNLLTRAIPEIGVVAASGGNHGVAVAFAAQKLNIAAKIFVPNITSPAKLERLRQFGADVVLIGERYDDALAASQLWAAESGALPVHAYDQIETLLGQGTVGLEFEGQAKALDTLLVAVGGGGLIGGIAAWYRGRVKLIGVEPIAAPTLFKALSAGEPIDAEAGGIAADSLAPRRVARLCSVWLSGTLTVRFLSPTTRSNPHSAFCGTRCALLLNLGVRPPSLLCFRAPMFLKPANEVEHSHLRR